MLLRRRTQPGAGHLPATSSADKGRQIDRARRYGRTRCRLVRAAISRAPAPPRPTHVSRSTPPASLIFRPSPRAPLCRPPPLPSDSVVRTRPRSETDAARRAFAWRASAASQSSCRSQCGWRRSPRHQASRATRGIGPQSRLTVSPLQRACCFRPRCLPTSRGDADARRL